MNRTPVLILPLLACLSCSPKQTAAPVAEAPPSVAPATPKPSPSPQGEDFTRDAKALFRVMACGGEDPIPEGLDKATVDENCAFMKARIEEFRKGYLAQASAYLAPLRPAGLPTTVVYPFGGGDLLSALMSFPDATDITTLSLEHAGDPRRIRDLSKLRLANSLKQIRNNVRLLLKYNESTSEHLMEMQQGDIPGQLSFFLVALEVFGYEPVSLRYFHVESDGSLHYYTAEEVAEEEKKIAKKLNAVWRSPDFSEAFSNVEIRFRPKGGGAERVHRHIAANLADDHLKADPSVLNYLEGKGTVSAMTKAASYLLWNPWMFSKIRDYLLSHMVFMFSDSTGIPPTFASKAGFVQETYGFFSGPYVPANKAVGEEFRKLWASQPQRPLDFRYGYPDGPSNRSHMMITRKASPAAAESPATR